MDLLENRVGTADPALCINRSLRAAFAHPTRDPMRQGLSKYAAR